MNAEVNPASTNSPDSTNKPTMEPVEPEQYWNYCEEKFEDETNENEPTVEPGNIT